ncbi:MAG: TIGR03087 family PEP-CTERM/XrtA system glycosyltransferase [Phycisphaerae bacterium]
MQATVQTLRGFDDPLLAPRRQSRILFLAHRFPCPPDKGDRIRAYHFLRRLAERHRVWCVAFADEPVSAAALAHMREMCVDAVALPVGRWRARAGALRSFLSGGTATQGALRSELMMRLVQSWAREHAIDTVVAYSSGMAPFALAVPNVRRVLDFCDVDSQKWAELAETARGPRRWIWSSEARRLRAAELHWAEQADCTLIITPRERELIARYLEPHKLAVVGNGVNVPADVSPPAESLGPVAGFVGAMDYAPSVDGMCWFVRQVWPQVRRLAPRASLLIVGRRPARAVQALAGRDGVCVTGGVSDVGAFLRRIRVGVAPLRVARGLPNKVLEMMAFGRPVVATSGVSECIECGPAAGVFVADDAGQFAQTVASLLTDDERCARAARAAHRRALARFDWASRALLFERMVIGPQRVVRTAPRAVELPLRAVRRGRGVRPPADAPGPELVTAGA